jgi:YVTN family beta-propeller protein
MYCKKVFLFASAISLFFISCSNDDSSTTEAPIGAYENGVLILNQGNFGTDNSSVSFLSNNFSVFENNSFGIVNPTEVLGDTGQDIGFYNDLAFIVLNNSQKIEVVNRKTLAHVTSIETGLSNPRYIAFSQGKGYITNWGDGGNPNDDYVAVINLQNYTVLRTIPVNEGPERIIVNNNKLYVAHQGGYNFGNTVTVIDANSNTVSESINVGDVPNSLKIQNDILYVLCGGKPSWSGTETAGILVKHDLTSNTSTSLDFATSSHPSNLYLSEGMVYYTDNSDVYSMSATAAALPSTPLFSTFDQGVYGVYSFAVENGRIFVGDAVDYSSNGKVYIYSTNGILEYEFTVGVIPAGFYFN